METILLSNRIKIPVDTVGNPLLSERDGNLFLGDNTPLLFLPVGNPLLSERDGNNSYIIDVLLC